MRVITTAKEYAGLVDTSLPAHRLAGQVLLVAAVALAAPASAQSISPDPQGSGVIAGAVNWLTGTLLGNVATGLAILAIAIIGILLAVGRIEWGRAAMHGAPALPSDREAQAPRRYPARPAQARTGRVAGAVCGRRA